MDIVERLRSAAITTSGRMSAKHRLGVIEALIDAATEIARLRKDAERYRWLRDNGRGDLDILWVYQGEELDRLIDSEISREKGANDQVQP